MKRLLKKVDAIFDGVVNIFALLAILITVFVLLTVNSEIVLRYAFDSPMRWVFEITEYSILWLTLFGSAWVLKTEGHVVMDTVLVRLRPKARSWVNTVTSLIGAAICLIITYYGVVITWDLYQRGVALASTLDPIAYPFYIIIPVAFFVLTGQFLRRAIGFLVGQRAASVEK